MKKRYKVYFGLNILSLMFVVFSFIFTTLAWFAYSGLSKVSTEMDVKAWYIELSNNGDPVSNELVINVPNIYPGMNSVSETIDIKNMGDSVAAVKYEIVSARILGDEYKENEEGVLDIDLEDKLSHDYPFKINMSLGKNFVLDGEDATEFNVSVSWPLDSGNNEKDTEWGTKAYAFQDNENKKHTEDNSYIKKTAIQIYLKVIAEQYLGNSDSAETRITVGDTVLYNPVDNIMCNQLSDNENCIKTTVIGTKNNNELDTNIKVGSTNLVLLPNVLGNLGESSYYNLESKYEEIVENWTVLEHMNLSADVLLKITSNDINGTFLTGRELSNIIVGSTKKLGRTGTLINDAIGLNGFFTFMNSKFPYLVSNKCFWTSTSYNASSAFAMVKHSETITRIESLDNASNCTVLPLMVVSKDKVIQDLEL